MVGGGDGYGMGDLDGERQQPAERPPPDAGAKVRRPASILLAGQVEAAASGARRSFTREANGRD